MQPVSAMKTLTRMPKTEDNKMQTVLRKTIDYYCSDNPPLEGYRLIFFNSDWLSVSAYSIDMGKQKAYDYFLKIVRYPSNKWKKAILLQGNKVLADISFSATTRGDALRATDTLKVWLTEKMEMVIEKKQPKIPTTHVHCFYVDTKSHLVRHKKIIIRNPQEPIELLVDDGTGFPESRWCIASKPDSKNEVTLVNLLCQKINSALCVFYHKPFYENKMFKREFDGKMELLKKEQSIKLTDSDFSCRYNSGVDKLTKLDISNIIDLYSKFIEQRSKR